MKFQKKYKKVILVMLVLLSLIVIIVFDFYDRLEDNGNRLSEMIFIENEYKVGDELKDDYPKDIYIRNFENKRYIFPRSEVDKINIYRNYPILSRLTSKTLSKTEKNNLIVFFNSSENFDWGETTWSLKESDYIIRFFDSNNNEISKVWVCLDR